MIQVIWIWRVLEVDVIGEERVGLNPFNLEHSIPLYPTQLVFIVNQLTGLFYDTSFGLK